MEDGTIVDDDSYFQTLQPQTVLIFVTHGEQVMTGADLIHQALTAVNAEFLRAGRLAQDYWGSNLKERVRQVSALLERADGSIYKSGRDEDPAWFEGTDTRAPTKESFMSSRARDRIRGFYGKTATEVRASDAFRQDAGARRFLEGTLLELRERLAQAGHFGYYFNRQSALGDNDLGKEVGPCLCNYEGEFRCGGRWNQPHCLYPDHHWINPYQSKEARLVFSTWNLDHGVERARSVTPAILDFARRASTANSKLVNKFRNAVFHLLFTTDNLKLVHIICHDKGVHANPSNRHFKVIQHILRSEVAIIDEIAG